MSATMAAWPHSNMANPALDQTTQHHLPPPSLNPQREFSTSSELGAEYAESTPLPLNLLAFPADDTMDHEPTPAPTGEVTHPDADLPTLSTDTNTYFPDQMNVDSDSNTYQGENFASEDSQELIEIGYPVPMDPTVAPQVSQDANRPTMVTVRTPGRGNPIQHSRPPRSIATLRPHGTNRLPAQTQPVQDDNPHSGEASSIEVGEDEEDDEEDEEEDDSDESEREFVQSMVEDLSVPTEEALQKIERTKEFSALDHSVWESRVYKPLEDPEYQPKVAGRIVWTLKGFHGTADTPNKQHIMRSPPIDIGGFLFNVKVFPKGNEGTDYVSVYVECTGPSAIPDKPSADNNLNGCADLNGAISATSKDCASTANWEVPAQIGCMMYNPQDPRVYKFEEATHHFQGDSPDWGWTRFYGPWTTLHVRRWDQRRPMLQNDTLAFCIYLRTVQDPTRGLWWQPTEGAQWNSYAKTGLRAIQGESSYRRAVAAALAPWFHLMPFRELIATSPIPRPHSQPQKRPWPMFEALHNILHRKSKEGASDDLVNIAMVEKLLNWYDADLSDSTDVVEIWENIRSTLNREFHGGRESISQSDVLAFIKTYKVVLNPQMPSDTCTSMPQKQKSLQAIVETLFEDATNTYQEWEGYKSGGKDLPPVLQIELIRQRYDPQTRAWKRLTHRVHINETVKVKDVSYRLFGLIVSRGKLGSGKTYSIVRSSDIQSQWVAYKSGKVALLTSQAAIRAHEGSTHCREGEESVAQVVIYVRNNCCKKTLPTRPNNSGTPILQLFPALEESQRKDMDPLATLPVVIHLANAFEGYKGPGIVDPYQPVLSGTSGIELGSHFNSESTIESVESYLRAMGTNDLQYKCSILEWQHPPFYQPPRPKLCSPTDKLGDVGTNCGQVHLWARRVSSQFLQQGCDTKLDGEISSNSKSMSPREIFVKAFDRSAQRVVGITSFVAIGDAKLSTFLPPATKLPPRPLNIYVEQGDGYHVKPSRLTLDTLVSQIPASCVLVVAHHPQGAGRLGTDHSEVHDYYQRERHRRHFAYQGPTYCRSHFGGANIRAQLHDGLVEGYGTMVETNGDYYSGCFKSGYLHGHGTMYYASGDTYFGAWSASERNGQGKMVYGSTGNTYIGEWREGRRHGSGTMTYKKADEQQAMCHICYGNEIDALFYRCGHILACESCARQCKDCPVCRKPVDAVVKIFDLRREGV